MRRAGDPARRAGPGLCSLLLAALPVAGLRAGAGRRAGCSGPGDGAALHFPLRAAVWDAYRRGELPAWNPRHLPRHAAARRVSARARSIRLMAALAALPPFTAFQVAGARSRSPRAGPAGLPLPAPAGRGARGRVRRRALVRPGPVPRRPPRRHRHGRGGARCCRCCCSPRRPTAAAARRGARRASRPALALLLLAGSPEAVARRGGAPRRTPARRPPLRRRRARGRPCARRCWRARRRARCWPRRSSLPTLLAAARGRARRHRPRRAGRRRAARASRASSCATPPTRPRPRWPWPRCPLVAAPDAGARARASRSLVCLAPAVGPRAAGRARRPALVFDLTLCVLAGLSLSAQWRARREPRGRRLRAYFLFACAGLRGRALRGRRRLGPLPADPGRRGGRARARPHPLLLAGRLAAHPARRRLAAAPDRLLPAAAPRPARVARRAARAPSCCAGSGDAGGARPRDGRAPRRARAHAGPRLAARPATPTSPTRTCARARRAAQRQRLRPDGARCARARPWAA